MSSSVPKPSTQRRRRNSVGPSRAERTLPTAGREGLAPTPPMPLGGAGMRWWSWAWSTPQATMWTHSGFFEALLKRAELEDLWERGMTLAGVPIDPMRLLPLMVRLDEQFGLTPRSAAQLHLSFEEPPQPEVESAPVADIRDRLKGLG